MNRNAVRERVYVKGKVKMARVSNFIYCLDSNTSDREANALGVISALTPDYIPGAFSFSILCSILDLPDGNHTVTIQFLDPQDVILVNVEGVIPYEKNKEENVPREYSGINISSNWQNVVLKKSGIYKTLVKVDGEQCGTYEIYVKGKNEVQ